MGLGIWHLGILLFFFSISSHAISYEELLLEARKQGSSLEVVLPPENEEEVRRISSKGLRAAKDKLRRILTQDPEERSFASTVGAFDELLDSLSLVTTRIGLVRSLGGSEELRDAAGEEAVRIQTFQENLFRNTALLEVLEPFALRTDLSEESKELVRRFRSAFPSLKSLKTIVTDAHSAGLLGALERLQSEFNEAVNNAKAEVTFTAEELRGVPPELLARLPKHRDDYVLDASAAYQYYGVVGHAESWRTRKRAFEARFKRGMPENMERLRQIAHIRREIARIYEVKSWMDHQLIGSPYQSSWISRQLKTLKEKTNAGYEADLAFLRTLLPEGVEPGPWDAGFVREQRYAQLDVPPSKEISEFFELESVLAKFISWIERGMGLRIEPVEGAPKWHESVRQYVVRDSAEGKILGLIALDLLPREGKDKWYFAETLRFARSQGDQKQRPYVFMMGNFPKNEQGKVLLDHSELGYLLHEFGHVFHYVLANPRFSYLSPESQNADLSEFPSTLWEELASEPEMLMYLGAHYETASPISKKMVDKMVKTRSEGSALSFRDLLVRVELDLMVHKSRPSVSIEAERKLFRDWFLPLGEGTSYLASFDYLTAGYDGQYWGYLWSSALAREFISQADQYSLGIMAPEFGRALRSKFMEPGATVSSQQILEDLFEKMPGFCSMLIKDKAS